MSAWSGSPRPLSIIVPVFNTEGRYLRPCLASIEACSLEGFRPEVIVVDDGSDPLYGDALPGILSEFDIDVRLYRKANGGQNSARNLGVEQATGDYILFLDSDDRLVPRSLATVLEAALAERPSLLCFNYDRVDPDGGLISHCGPWRGGYRKSESLSVFIPEGDSLFRQLYCRRAFIDTGIKLVEGPKIGEDMASAVTLLLAMGDAASIGETPYLYVQRPTSVLHAGAADRVFDIIDSVSWMVQNVGKASGIYGRELEALCVEHVLFWGGVRAINAFGASSAAKRRLFLWMDERFPAWGRSSCLNTLAERHGLDFALVVGGRWRAYSALLRLRRLEKVVLSALVRRRGRA